MAYAARSHANRGYLDFAGITVPLGTNVGANALIVTASIFNPVVVAGQIMVATTTTFSPTLFNPTITGPQHVGVDFLSAGPSVLQPSIAVPPVEAQKLTITPAFFAPLVVMWVDVPLLDASPTIFNSTVVGVQAVAAQYNAVTVLIYQPDVVGPQQVGANYLVVAPTVFSPARIGGIDAPYVLRRHNVFAPRRLNAEGYRSLILADEPYSYTPLDGDFVDDVGAITWTTSGSPATSTQTYRDLGLGSYNFNGSSALVSSTAASARLGTDTYTIELWFRPGSIASAYRYLYGFADFGVRIYTYGSVVYFLYYDSSGGANTLSTAFNQYGWNHLMAIADGTQQYLFVNSVGTIAGTTRTTTTHWGVSTSDRGAIGRNGRYASDYWNGQISNLAMYQRALTWADARERVAYIIGNNSSRDIDGGYSRLASASGKRIGPSIREDAFQRRTRRVPKDFVTSDLHRVSYFGSYVELNTDDAYLLEVSPSKFLFIGGNTNYDDVVYRVVDRNLSTNELTWTDETALSLTNYQSPIGVAWIDSTTLLIQWRTTADAIRFQVYSWDGVDTLTEIGAYTPHSGVHYDDNGYGDFSRVARRSVIHKVSDDSQYFVSAHIDLVNTYRTPAVATYRYSNDTLTTGDFQNLGDGHFWGGYSLNNGAYRMMCIEPLGNGRFIVVYPEWLGNATPGSGFEYVLLWWVIEVDPANGVISVLSENRRSGFDYPSSPLVTVDGDSVHITYLLSGADEYRGRYFHIKVNEDGSTYLAAQESLHGPLSYYDPANGAYSNDVKFIPGDDGVVAWYESKSAAGYSQYGARVGYLKFSDGQLLPQSASVYLDADGTLDDVNGWCYAHIRSSDGYHVLLVQGGGDDYADSLIQGHVFRVLDDQLTVGDSQYPRS